jgi:8-hydroxy-5-deazaflavin:NADPH oxidoreductase
VNIGIIGAGKVGGTLGQIWSKKGHTIVYGVRDPKDARAQAAVSASGGKARATSVAEAAAASDVVVLATPWPAAQAAIRAAGNLAGKIVVDCTNPLKIDLSGLDVGHTTSGGEKVAEWARGAKVVKAFNTTGANNMADPLVGGVRTVMFVAGDDAAAKKIVIQLSNEIGFDTVDAGPLASARLLEPWAMLWIHLAFDGPVGRDFAFAMLRRGR